MSNCPFVYLSNHPSVYLSFLSTDLSVCEPIHLLSSLSVFAAVHPSSYFCLCVHLSIFLSTSLFRDLSVSLSLYLSVVLWSIHHPCFHNHEVLKDVSKEYDSNTGSNYLSHGTAIFRNILDRIPAPNLIALGFFAPPTLIQHIVIFFGACVEL